jgi:hypothetical protein
MGLTMEIHPQILKIIVNISVVQVTCHAKQIRIITKYVIKDNFDIFSVSEIGDISRDNDQIR